MSTRILIGQYELLLNKVMMIISPTLGVALETNVPSSNKQINHHRLIA